MIQPIRDNVLIKPLESEKVSAGGILIAASFERRNNKAVVVAAGKGTAKKPMEFSKGDIVFNIQNAGDEIIEAGESYFLVKDKDILAYG